MTAVGNNNGGNQLGPMANASSSEPATIGQALSTIGNVEPLDVSSEDDKNKQRQAREAARAKRQPLKRSIRIAIMTLVLLLVLGTGVTCFLTVSPGGKRVIASLQQMAKNRQYAQYAQQHIKSATDADKVFMDGKVDEAVWWYQDQIAKAKANKDQAKLADLYYRLSSNYYVLGMNLSIDNKTRATNCKISLEYALKAEEAQPSVKTAAALTDRYRALNDTKNYNKYAQILRDRVKAETNGKIEG